MDFLNTAFSQVSDLFRSMTPGARLTAGLLLVMVVVSLGYLFTYQVSSADQFLMGGQHFSTSELRAMEAAWGKAKLNGYEVVGTQVRVPAGEKDQYMGALVDAKALPPTWGQPLDDALGNTSPFVSKQQREAQIRNAKQKELALWISAMDGIEKAGVLYDTRVKPGLIRETQTTATVSVKTLGARPLATSRVSAIRHAVAGAIAGMKAEEVNVIDLNTGQSFHGDSEGAGSPTNDAYAMRKQMYEQQWKQKIQKALSYVPGVTVEPNVELDRDKVSHTNIRKLDPKTVALESTEKSISSQNENTGPAGAPGYKAQEPNRPRALAAGRGTTSRQEQSEDETQTRNALSGTEEEKTTVGLTPKRVTVAVSVPNSYFVKIFKEQNPPAEGEEPKAPDQNALAKIRTEEIGKIKAHVANLLPEVEGVTDATQLVTVTPFQDITPEAIPSPGFSDKALSWLAESWRTLGMIGLVLFSLLMLRSMIRSAPEAAMPGHKPAASLLGEMAEETEKPDVGSQLGRFTGSGRSLRDDLSDLVREDPDAAANILRTWIGSSTIKP